MKLPRDMPRRARLVLFAALAVVDDLTREVAGGFAELQRLTGIDTRQKLSRNLQWLELAGFVRRGGQPVGTRIFVRDVALLARAGRTCRGCTRVLPQSTRNSGRWCDGCRQTLGRVDRAWMPRAIALAVEGKTPPEIAAIVHWPLWRPPDEHAGQASAVVPLLLAEGLVGEEWREALEHAVGVEQARELVKGAGLRTGRWSA
jgi:hypothetical protein